MVYYSGSEMPVIFSEKGTADVARAVHSGANQGRARCPRAGALCRPDSSIVNPAELSVEPPKDKEGMAPRPIVPDTASYFVLPFTGRA
jgi:hypothetical protein